MLRLFSAVALAALAGCSNAPPPIATAPIIEAKAPEFQAPPKPKESDAASKVLLNDIVAAHTGGKPERLAKVASIAFERTGLARAPNGDYPQLSWQGKIVGYRKYYAMFRNVLPGGVEGVYIYNGTRGAFGRVGNPLSPMTPSNIRDVTLQMGEESVIYLYGLNDPAIVAQTATVEKIGDNAMLGLHLWSPGVEHVLLSVDAKTKLVARVQYLGSEAGTPTLKDLRITSHREIAGLKLPEKYTVTANGILLFEWEKLTFDPEPTLDAKLFEVP